MASFKVKVKYMDKNVIVSMVNGKLVFDDLEFEKHFRKIMPMAIYQMPLPAGEVIGVTEDDPEGIYIVLIELYHAKVIVPPSEDMFDYHRNRIY